MRSQQRSPGTRIANAGARAHPPPAPGRPRGGESGGEGMQTHRRSHRAPHSRCLTRQRGASGDACPRAAASAATSQIGRRVGGLFIHRAVMGARALCPSPALWPPGRRGCTLVAAAPTLFATNLKAFSRGRLAKYSIVNCCCAAKSRCGDAAIAAPGVAGLHPFDFSSPPRASRHCGQVLRSTDIKAASWDGTRDCRREVAGPGPQSQGFRGARQKTWRANAHGRRSMPRYDWVGGPSFASNKARAER